VKVGDEVSVGRGEGLDLGITGVGVAASFELSVEAEMDVGVSVIVASGIEVGAGEKFSAPTTKIAMIKSTTSPPPHIQADL